MRVVTRTRRRRSGDLGGEDLLGRRRDELGRVSEARVLRAGASGRDGVLSVHAVTPVVVGVP